MSGIFNLAIGLVIGGGSGLVSRYFLKKAAQYGNRRATLMFSNSFRRKLIAKHISARIAGYVASAVGVLFTVYSAFSDPGGGAHFPDY